MLEAGTPTSRTLPYASPATNRWRYPATRLSKQSAWGDLAALLAGLTLTHCVMCCVGMYLAAGGGRWVLFGLIGSWLGGGFGILFALIGCLQRTHRRSRSARALWWNACLIALPFAVIIFLILREWPVC